MGKKIARREFLKKSSKIAVASGLTGCGLLLKGCTTKQEFDLVIKGGRVFDGLGNEAFVADIGVIGDSIKKIGKIPHSRGKSIIDAENKVVSPGFIDAHDHTDIGLLVNPKAESHIRQGITTLVSGNCGSSPFPVAAEISAEIKDNLKNAYNIKLDWKDITGFLSRLKKRGMALNYSTFVGLGTIRGAAMGFNDRPPKDRELDNMKVLVKENIQNGALGISTGLEYAPGSYALPAEIAELCQTAADSGGMYATHMRDEGDYLIESLDETCSIARKTGIRVQISHFKIAYSSNWGKINDAISRIEQAENEGISIYCDRYPYIAGATGLSSFNFPLWAKQGTTSEFIARLKDPNLENKLRTHFKKREKKLGSWDKVIVSSVSTEKNRRFEGKTVKQGAEDLRKDEFDFVRDLLIEENDRVGMIVFMMSEKNLKRILSHPLVGIGCDASALAPYGPLGKGKPHPRSYGTFPRVLGKYIREEKLLPIKDMLKKMTSVPARNFGFFKRGVLQVGNFADIVIFDEDKIIDKATWKNPHQYPEGIECVLVNGSIVIQNSEHTGNLGGRILYRSP